MNVDQIRTTRLFGERIATKHFDELVAIHSDPKAMATLGGLRSAETTQEYLTTNIQHWEQYGFGLWMFHDTAGALVGRGGIRHVIADNVDEIEIAYALVPQFWGQGIATEMAREFTNVAKQLGLKELTAITQITNNASRNVMNKLGFEFEKEFVHHQTPCILCRLALD